jgi:uncharacterized repeat protein (TIGR03803 family)
MLHNFSGGSDGGYPVTQPVVDKSGNMFGTATGGGDSACYEGCGTVWELSASGTFSVLHTFMISDGNWPDWGVTLGREGMMYGTTGGGGSAGWGTAFSMDSAGTFTTLYNFGASGDPGDISSGVALDSSGNLYGMSYEGGSFGMGTVWKLSSGGKETNLHNFSGGSDGGYPDESKLHKDRAGNLYGVAEYGGSSGCGTLFEVVSAGAFKLLHSFNCRTDGGYPTGGIREFEGSIYGAALDYGSNGSGTVWRYDLKKHKFSVLHSFSYSDGAFPWGGVGCQPRKKGVCTGNLFGTTETGGYNQCGGGCGTVWEITASGKFITLHKFSGSDGAHPYDRPFVDRRGNVYGTTWEGGSSGYGTVWELTP